MLKQIVFQKDERVMPIDIDTLINSSDYDRGKKFPKSHHEILTDVMNIMTAEGYQHELSELYISKSGVIPPKEREVAFRTDIDSIYDTRGIQITNLIAKINMQGELTNKDSSQSFALSINKNGIEVSFGTNISICSNMTIFGDSHLKNFGADSIDFDKMFEIIRLWIKTSKKRRENDLRIIEQMKLVTFTNFLKESREIIGHFNELLIRDGNTAPLRQARITDVHRNLLDQYDKSIQFGETFNLWNMFNVFTQASSSQDVLENIIGNSVAVGKFFVERYNLNEIEGETVVVDVATIVKERPLLYSDAENSAKIPPIVEEITITVKEDEQLKELTDVITDVTIDEPDKGVFLDTKILAEKIKDKKKPIKKNTTKKNTTSAKKSSKKKDDDKIALY